jgi:hypothetical protein
MPGLNALQDENQNQSQDNSQINYGEDEPFYDISDLIYEIEEKDSEEYAKELAILKQLKEQKGSLTEERFKTTEETYSKIYCKWMLPPMRDDLNKMLGWISRAQKPKMNDFLVRVSDIATKIENATPKELMDLGEELNSIYEDPESGCKKQDEYDLAVRIQARVRGMQTRAKIRQIRNDEEVLNEQDIRTLNSTARGLALAIRRSSLPKKTQEKLQAKLCYAQSEEDKKGIIQGITKACVALVGVTVNDIPFPQPASPSNLTNSDESSVVSSLSSDENERSSPLIDTGASVKIAPDNTFFTRSFLNRGECKDIDVLIAHAKGENWHKGYFGGRTRAKLLECGVLEMTGCFFNRKLTVNETNKEALKETINKQLSQLPCNHS